MPKEQSEHRKKYLQEYYQNHQAEYAARTKKWNAEHPDKVREANHKQYLKRKAAKNADK